MSHTSFILASYIISAVVMLWVALAPFLKRRSLARQLKAKQLRTQQSHMENTQ